MTLMHILVFKTETREDDGPDQVIQPMADASGAELQFISVPSVLHPCTGCGKCSRTHACTFDDGLGNIVNAVNVCDGVLFLTSLLYGCPDNTFINLIKRLCTSRPDVLRQKPVSVIGLSRSQGSSMDLSEVDNLLNSASMIRVYGPYGMVITSSMSEEDAIRLCSCFANLLWASRALKNEHPKLETMPRAPYRIR